MERVRDIAKSNETESPGSPAYARRSFLTNTQ